MTDNKLISMTDFVLDKQDKYNYDRFYCSQFKDTVVNYANFLKQPLKLEMFVPCDDEGNVLKKEHYFDYGRYYVLKTHSENDFKIFNEYQNAKEKVLFEGFEAKNYLNLVGLKHKTWDSWCMGCYKTVEDLSGCKNIFITESALKKIQP